MFTLGRPSRGVTVFTYAVGVLALLLFLFPIFWMVLTSFKTTAQAITSVPILVFTPTLENYREVLLGRNFLHYIQNSLVIGLVSTLLTLALAVTVAYPLARYKLKGDRHLTSWILSLRIIPPIVSVVPLYIIFSRVNLTDQYPALIIMYTFMNLPLAVWMLRGFFADIPRELEEAALVDGSTPIGSFFRIALPLVAPGLAAAGMLSLIFCWNEFLFANVLTAARTKTAPVGLTEYATPVSVLWTQIMAAGTVVVLPVIAMGVFIQRYLVRGLALGAVKG
ncbi:MAG: mannitol transporter permease [Thermomicrobiales bacterium]|jgi:multiple sugar transport system permease protein|nr:mannitol transporter permease [Thermomicrobiales bacterium]